MWFMDNQKGFYILDERKNSLGLFLSVQYCKCNIHVMKYIPVVLIQLPCTWLIDVRCYGNLIANLSKQRRVHNATVNKGC